MKRIIIFINICLKFSNQSNAQVDSLASKFIQEPIIEAYDKNSINLDLFLHTYMLTAHATRWFGKKIMKPYEIKRLQKNIYLAYKTETHYILAYYGNPPVNQLVVFDHQYKVVVRVYLWSSFRTYDEILQHIKAGNLNGEVCN
jgi:hypothetical protein